MRIVFFGTPALALPTLERVAAEHEVAAVVCQPDRPQGRSKKLVPPPAKEWAEAHGVPVVQPVKLNDGTFEAWLREQQPDVCVLVAYGRILKQPILDVPPHGFFNMHPSLLPRHRGPSPIQTAILVGDEVTGVSIMRLDAGMDTGDVLLQREEPIRPEDTAVTLSARLEALGAEMMAEALGLAASGQAVFAPQDDSKATVTKMYTKEDGRIRWDESAVCIRNRVRAALPWPVAHTDYRGNTWRVLEASIIDEATDAAPGTVIRTDKSRIYVATGSGVLALERIQVPGKKAMAVADFLRGHPVPSGEHFGEPS